MRLASPAQIPAGYWERCPYCDKPVFLPIAGGKESKGLVQCPHCSASLRPEC